MTTFPPTSSLSSPEGDEPIPVGTLGYFQARNRNRLYDLVVGEFIRSGISQATLARRLRKSPDIICRWLGAPGNWTSDTASNLLFAISGAEPRYDLSYPIDEDKRNYIRPEWLQTQINIKSVANTSTEKSIETFVNKTILSTSAT